MIRLEILGLGFISHGVFREGALVYQLVRKQDWLAILKILGRDWSRPLLHWRG